MNKSFKILSLEAKDLYAAMNMKNADGRGYLIRNSEGRINLKKFTAVFDWSLDSMHLQEVYEKRVRRKDFAFVVNHRWYTKNVINVTFNYSYKNYNKVGKNTFVKEGYSYRDCVFTDSACVIDGELIGIQVSEEVENPVSPDVLGPYFRFNGTYYEPARSLQTVMNAAALRGWLYENGFWCEGVHYVRYKRSAGSSRVGKCLFVNELVAADMEKWDKCGLDIKPGDRIDLAAYEAYISLPMSSIIDTLEITPESILVIDEFTSKFDDEVISVSVKENHLFAEKKVTTIKNDIFDGESLIDRSAMGKYENKGMLLLRNRFFKSCCFNTNIQQFFADNGITSVDQLNGFTLAADVSQIKLITTPSSIKYVKFGSLEQWFANLVPTFGVVKYEKPPHPFGGRMVQAHYQLFNTLHLSYEEMEEIMKPSLDYIAAVRNDPEVLRYDIRFPDEIETGLEPNSIKSKNEIIYKMLGINDKFSETKLYLNFRDDLVRSKLRNLKQGHVLVNGNYSTMMGNGLELLRSACGMFDGKSSLPGDCIHTSRFPYGTDLLCSRSPHVTISNIMLARNVECEEIDRYFNLTPEIVCVNAIENNIQQKLNGCDYDSDTILITDNAKLIEVAKRDYGKYLVPTNEVSALKTTRYYTSAQKADLDVKTSVNKIGEIINLSQQLNSLLWEKLNKGASRESVEVLFEDICKLAVLSNVEIEYGLGA